MSGTFPNSPLYEAVFQLRFAGELGVEVSRAAIQAKVRSELPKLYVPRATPGMPLALEPIQFRSDDEKEMVGIALNTFSYHTQRYEGYASFKERFLRFWAVFSEHVHITKLTRVGLRYINHIPVLRPSSSAPIPLEDYLNIKLQMPAAIAGDLTELNTAFQVRMEGGVLRILLEHKTLETPPQSEILLLDFDFGQEDGLAVSDVELYLERAHRHTKQIFLELVSEKYLEVMRSPDR